MSLRHQLVVESDEIGTAMDITSISFLVTEGEEVTFPRFQVHMGYSELNALGTVFDENYLPGTRTLVYDHTGVTYTSTGAGDWLTLDLDRNFWYNGSKNLIMEFSWPGGDMAIYVWGWIPDGNHTLFGEYGAVEGNLLQESLFMRLNGTLAMEASTFGAIKATLGQ